VKLKPTPKHPIRVYDVVHVWRGIYSVCWIDELNYPRAFTSLYRRITGQWFTGEVHPTGVHGQPLRVAPAIIAIALEQASTLTVPDNQ